MELQAEEMQDTRRAALLRMEEMIDGRVNDAVKLAFLDEERPDEIDGLDLSALTEFKRSSNGAVEMKFINRLAVLEKWLALVGGSGEDRAAAFFRALDGRAEVDGGV